MPLEPNPVTVGALLVAIVVATIGGGLIGRRLRTWNERRVARRAVATLTARQSLPAPRPVRPTTTPSGSPIGGASAAAVGGSYLSRRLAGEPPPVFARRPSGLSPAVEMRASQPVTAIGAAASAEAAAQTAAAATATPAVVPQATPAPTNAFRPRPGSRRRTTIVVALASLVFAVGAGLGIVAATASGPSGAVLDETGTPGPTDVPETVVPGNAGADPTGESIPPDESATRLPLIAGATDLPSPTAEAPTRPPLPSSPLSVRPGTQAAGPHETPVPGRRDPPADDPTHAPTPKPPAHPAETPSATPPPTPPPTPAPTAAPTPEPPPAGNPPKVRFGFVVVGSTVWFANYTTGAVDASWDFGDGATSSSWNPHHQYATPGQYTVTLTAVNRAGAAAGKSHTVTIGD